MKKEAKVYITRPHEQNNENDFYVVELHIEDIKGYLSTTLESTNDKAAISEAYNIYREEAEVIVKEDLNLDFSNNFEFIIGFNE